jgi:hypothetical protein
VFPHSLGHARPARESPWVCASPTPRDALRSISDLYDLFDFDRA